MHLQEMSDIRMHRQTDNRSTLVRNYYTFFSIRKKAGITMFHEDRTKLLGLEYIKIEPGDLVFDFQNWSGSNRRLTFW